MKQFHCSSSLYFLFSPRLSTSLLGPPSPLLFTTPEMESGKVTRREEDFETFSAIESETKDEKLEPTERGKGESGWEH